MKKRDFLEFATAAFATSLWPVAAMAQATDPLAFTLAAAWRSSADPGPRPAGRAWRWFCGSGQPTGPVVAALQRAGSSRAMAPHDDLMQRRSSPVLAVWDGEKLLTPTPGAWQRSRQGC